MDSTRYFQLTSNILIEYKYNTPDNNNAGDVSYKYIDLKNQSFKIIKSKNGNVYFNLDKIYKDPYDYDNIEYKNSLKNFVIPTNISESQFKKAENINPIDTIFSDITPNFSNTNDNTDILADNFTLHFTSGQYFEGYDGLIFSAYVYDNIKNKICLFSQIIEGKPKINENPILINQKLYTSYYNFKIPNLNSLINDKKNLLKTVLTNNDIMKNSPLVFNVYGISKIPSDGSYITEKISSIYIPFTNVFNTILVDVNEANDGDYFEIKAKTSNKQSISDYISEISNGHPEAYVLMYDVYVDENITKGTETGPDTDQTITNRCQHLVNTVIDDNGNLKINEEQLETPIMFRPVLINNNVVNFNVNVTMRLLNTIDNTTIVAKGGCLCFFNPNKYGKKLSCIGGIDLSNRPIVNVYNKKIDADLDNIKLTKTNSNATIENHQHSITGFIETINVGVSIEQLPAEITQ